MEKRGFLTLLWALFLAFIPAATAEITVVSPEQTTFNFGDQLNIEGTIVETADHTGFLKFELDCGETEVLATRAVTLRANTERDFEETFTIPQTITGNCKLRVAFESNNAIITETASTAFTVTSALNAPLALSKESVQLGDKVSIAGTITKMDGKAIEGVAKASFKQGKDIIVQDIVKITKGKFSYTYDTEDSPAGSYEISVEITDINNNKQIVTFDNFMMLGNIGLIITLNDNEFLPGEKVKIDGTAKTSESRITKGTAYITLDDRREEVTILLGILKQTITLPVDIETGEHTVTIDVEDTHGNKETQQFVITIIAVPTRLELAMNQESYMPEQQVVIKPTLYDQGNDVIDTEINLDVYDAEKDVIFTDTIKSTEQTAFTLPRSAAPGFWRVKATAMDVDGFMSFKIEEFKVIDITQEGSVIIFSNTGNIPVKEFMVITLTNKDDPTQSITKQKKVALEVGESKAFDLAYLAAQGSYTVQVGDKIFETVEIPQRRWSIMPYIAVILGLLILYLVIRLLPKYKILHRTHHHEKKLTQPHHGQPVQRHRSEEWYEEKLKRDLAEHMEAKRQKVQFSFKKRKDEYVMELQKKRKSAENPSPWVKKQAKQEQNEAFMNTQDFSDPWKTQEEQKKEEEKPKKGLFGLFD